MPTPGSTIFHVGELVFVKRNSTKNDKSKRLQAVTEGPMQVAEVLTPTVVRIKHPYKRKILKYTIHTSKLLKCAEKWRAPSETNEAIEISILDSKNEYSKKRGRIVRRE